MLKRCNVFILLFILCFTLSGCSMIESSLVGLKNDMLGYFNSKYESMKASTTTAKATKQIDTILECVLSKDSEILKTLFMPYIQEYTDLDGQIENFFNFIDGEIVSYEEPTGSRGGGEIRNGEKVFERLNGHICNIKTEKGKEYEIQHGAVHINKKHPEDIGVYQISIVDKEIFTNENNYPDSGIAYIGIESYSN